MLSNTFVLDLLQKTFPNHTFEFRDHKDGRFYLYIDKIEAKLHWTTVPENELPQNLLEPMKKTLSDMIVSEVQKVLKFREKVLSSENIEI